MISRRHFLQSSLTVALVPFLPPVALSQTLRVRPNWTAFRTSSMYPIFVDTVRRMRANTNSADPNSWAYWVNVHRNFCPHGIVYFLAWHRGYVHRFEAQLRKVAANNGLMLPYWNYYSNPIVPSEFTADTTSPLYVPNRAGNDVTNALSLNPFADTIINFQRGLTNAFEPTLESRPHNAVHNLIGGVLGAVTVSPRDPIFWVHHGNIDRLWAAWVNADAGRTMPPATDPYWSGSFNYGPAVPTMARRYTISTTGLNYRYDNETMPSSLPTSTTAMLAPLALELEAVPPRPIGSHTVSLGGARALALNERSASVNVPLTPQDGNRVRTLLLQQTGRRQASDAIRVVLDGVRLTGAGANGGFFYNVYINLPEQVGGTLPESAYLLGTLGPFEISTAQHHAMGGAVRLTFPATEALQRISPQPLDRLSVSFVRVNGSTPVRGTVITVAEFRVEAADIPAP